MRIYLDHNATAPLAPAARAAMLEAASTLGNPSSIHGDGRAARALVEDARAAVARLCGGEVDEVVFTSGGTEACALGLVGLARLARDRGRPARILIPAIDHPATLGAAEALAREGFAIAHVRVDGAGRIDLDALAADAAAGGAVIAIAAANHELGTIQDVAAIAAIARAHGWLVHLDAVQAAGKVALAPLAAAVDALAISGHKLGGPAGVGAAWLRRGLAIEPLWPGGHQERGRRPGTENLVGIAGLGAAALAADPARFVEVAARAARFEAQLVALGATIRAQAAPRIGNTVNARFAGARGDAIVMALDLAEVSASTGAACTSGSIKPSAVLLAVGEAVADARAAVRFSLGADTTDAELDRVIELLPAIVARVRRHAPT
ncbi:MAG: aminotransferase class V-fold PLP-dependent enzyme [Deltaproteobacteria bacterium]|nr:aminotransferase class V-fold PLP-dependent enzyme [Deltaproteobacteria bacterium]